MKYIAFALATLLLMSANARAQNKEWLTLPLGPAQDLVLEESGSRTARVPVRAPDGASSPKSPLKIRLFDVSSKAGHGKQLADQFAVNLVAATDNKDAAIEVVVPKGSSEVVPGPYALSLTISPDFNDRKSIQTLGVTLTVPGPQIAVDPVLVGVEEGFLFFTSTQINLGDLRVSEKDGKTSVGNLDVTFVKDPVATGQPQSGRLSLVSKIAVVPAGGVAAAPVSIVGDFEPGEVSGKIEIRSRDLAAPVSTTYKVRDRRSLLWIVVLVAAGSTAGYFIRNYLAQRQLLLEAAAVASTAVGLVDTELAHTTDPTYIAELNKLRGSMAEPIERKEPGDITKASGKLQEDLIAARGRFEQRLQPFTLGAIALHNLTDKEWAAPPSVLATLQALRAASVELSRALAQRNADGAKDLLETRLPPLLVTALGAVDTAGGNVGRLAEIVATNAPPLSDLDLGHLTDAASEFAKRFPLPAPGRVDATVDQLFAALSAWTTDGSVVRALLATSPSLFGAFFVWVKDQLGPAVDPRLEALGAQTTAALEAAQFPEQFDKDMPDFVGLQARLTTLRADWRQYFGVKAPNVPAADLDDAVQRSEWTRAAELVRAATARSALGPTDLVQRDSEPPVVSSAPVAEGLPPPKGTNLGFQPASLLLGTVEERLSLLDAAGRASRLQTLLMAVLFVIGVYCLYRDTWIGSDKEMIALFMLAFGLDLTTDSVAAVFKKLKMPDI